ncbi:hypothetical protein PsorP6_011953 [Peronosclerospora sorghi]|uniref:Uncharacterized protein n=1 Tax=Peronosclerospora sorghi TaxID=230839 RepID=A0ACC0WLC5_9STRA|nr:hypothetical protein PsorP6_011953 [Peronosclerospora sorghi]
MQLQEGSYSTSDGDRANMCLSFEKAPREYGEEIRAAKTTHYLHKTQANMTATLQLRLVLVALLMRSSE